MKPYVITTGILFTVITALHVWRAVAEWPHGAVDPSFFLFSFTLVALPGAMAGWAWRVFRNLAASRAESGSENMPGKN
jgi:hypothetical protein